MALYSDNDCFLDSFLGSDLSYGSYSGNGKVISEYAKIQEMHLSPIVGEGSDLNINIELVTDSGKVIRSVIKESCVKIKSFLNEINEDKYTRSKVNTINDLVNKVVKINYEDGNSSLKPELLKLEINRYIF